MNSIFSNDNDAFLKINVFPELRYILGSCIPPSGILFMLLEHVIFAMEMLYKIIVGTFKPDTGYAKSIFDQCQSMQIETRHRSFVELMFEVFSYYNNLFLGGFLPMHEFSKLC